MAIVDGFRDVMTLAFIAKCLIIMVIGGSTTIGIMAIGTLAGKDPDDS